MRPPRKTGYQFGTFQGVLLPSFLTILGVIMYLRLGCTMNAGGVVEPRRRGGRAEVQPDAADQR